MIYQLKKTGVAVTGQVKWNLIMGGTKVLDLQFSPINEVMPSYQRNDVMNYTHLENLNILYKNGKDKFFTPYTLVSEDYPMIKETSEDSYISRCYRMSYKKFNKEFAFFCPIFLDNPDDWDDLSFRFIVKGWMNTDTLIEIPIDHTFINDYVRRYLNETMMVDGTNFGNEILNIDLESSIATIRGVDVESHKVVRKDISTIIPNLRSTERPVMETDNMLCRVWEENHMIMPQILNLNFVFNLEDIVPLPLIHHLHNRRFNAYVEIYKGKNKVNTVDIYDNYDQIPVFDVVGNRYNNSYNVLDWIKDNKCIDIINRNRIVQNTFHWALYENQKYIFNLYSGFAPLYAGKGIQGSGLYGSQPAFGDNSFAPWKNNLQWTNVIIKNDGSIKDNFKAVKFIEEIMKDGSNFGDFTNIDGKPDYFWAGTTRYNKGLFEANLKKAELDCGGYKICITLCNGTIDMGNLQNTLKGSYSTYLKGNNILILSGDKILMFIYGTLDGTDTSGSYNLKGFTISNLRGSGLTELFGIGQTENPIRFIKAALNSIAYPSTIIFDNILIPEKTNGPTDDIEEIEYVKEPNNGGVYVMRYGGRLLPFLIGDTDEGLENYFYTNKQGKYYDKYVDTGFSPLYPSIGYGMRTGYDKKGFLAFRQSLTRGFEGGMFDNNKLFNLAGEVVVKYKDISLDEGTKFDLFFSNCIILDDDGQPIYDPSNPEYHKDLLKYIYNLYKCEVVFEYDDKLNEDGQFVYNYNITYKLR